MQKHDENGSNVVFPIVIRKQILLVGNIVVISQRSIFVFHQVPVVEVHIVNVQDKSNLLDQMGDGSEEMVIEGETIPLVFDEVFN